MQLLNNAGDITSENQFTPGKTINESTDRAWLGLYRVGGAAALAAGIVFRRNLAAEISLFSPQARPVSVADWFGLLQSNRLLGLTYLGIFDIVDYLLVGSMLLAICAALRKTHPGSMAAAAVLGGLGVSISLASNTAFSMLALSSQFAAAGTAAQREMLLAAGQALLAISDVGAVFPGTGIYLGCLFIAAAGVISSIAMLRGGRFNRVSAYIGILAGGIDLVYCITFAFLPALTVYLLSAAGFFLMIWHILAGWQLVNLGKIR